MPSKYINPYTDFGFKKLFGEEGSKNLLSDFLNTLLPQEHQITTLTFRNPDVLGDLAEDRRAVFDIYCENAEKEHFIVEMQKAEQEYFKDRSVFYSTHPIRNQAPKGKWNYELKAVYFIGVLDFIYDESVSDAVLIRDASLKDQFGKEFYKKLHYIFLQMPVFSLQENALKTHQDKWLYFLKHLPSFDFIPQILNEPIFHQAFHTAEIAAMSPEEQEVYDQSQKDYWSYLATIETAEKKGRDEGFAKGLAEGEAKGKAEVARNMKKKGLDSAMISEITGLPVSDVEKL
ncbi:hypothetical protein FACS189427_05510 [Planctomycetales bacterium]|nr:hypothetical protein FACS189427_05510 [Planctomycetales bacterium]